MVPSSAAPNEARRARRRLAWPLAAVIAVRVRVLSRQRRACVRLNGRATNWRIRMPRHRRGWMAFHLHVVGRADEPCCGYPKATGSGLFLEAAPVVAGTTLGSGQTTRWCACAENGVIEAVPSARAHAGSFCGNLAHSSGRRVVLRGCLGRLHDRGLLQARRPNSRPARTPARSGGHLNTTDSLFPSDWACQRRAESLRRAPRGAPSLVTW